MRFKDQNKKLPKPALKQTATERIRIRCVLWKTQWASWMGDKYNRLSFKNKTITLLCFVAIFGGYSVYLVASALQDRRSINHPASHISIPRHIETGVKSPEVDYAVQSKEYRRIHRFRIYMDSLYKDSEGRSLYDSIMQMRPGLMDSVYRVEGAFTNGNYDKNR